MRRKKKVRKFIDNICLAIVRDGEAFGIIYDAVLIIVVLIVLSVSLSGCSDEKSAGEDCDNKGEVICGTTCVDIGSSDTCGNEDAVLYCDGYEWMVSQKCAGDCSCIEKNGSAYCECPNYY